MSDETTYYLIAETVGDTVNYLQRDEKFTSNVYTAREFSNHKTASAYLNHIKNVRRYGNFEIVVA